MPAHVPFHRANFALGDIQVGAAVRAQTWRPCAELAHWVRGRGMSIVPAGFSGRQFTSGTETFHHKMRPSPFAVVRVWEVRASTATAAGGAMQIKIGASPTRDYVVPASTWFGVSPIVYVEELASKVTAVTDTTITFTHVAGTIQIDSVGCWEVPRAILDADTTEYGVDLESLFALDIIKDEPNESAHALAELVDDLNPRRVHFAQFHNTFSTSSASFVDAYRVPIRVMGQSLFTGVSVESMTWDVYARMTTGGASGTVQITANSGDTDTLTVSSTSFSWVGTGSVDINVEDIAEDDGLPSSTWETVQIAGRVDSGGGDIEIRASAGWRDS